MLTSAIASSPQVASEITHSGYRARICARINILDALRPMKTVYNDRPNSFFMQFFFNAKADELVSLFQQGTPDEKTQVTLLLSQIDPGNIAKYNTIASGK